MTRWVAQGEVFLSYERGKIDGVREQRDADVKRLRAASDDARSKGDLGASEWLNSAADVIEREGGW